MDEETSGYDIANKRHSNNPLHVNHTGTKQNSLVSHSTSIYAIFNTIHVTQHAIN